ncbi:MAG: fumarate reductase subunit C [Candidatus Tectomicrobia bacterium]|uniref:Fumarate reductase subunit C n=1 Tax=Tectimicrobiota bacterium TaxID=2528274 RepID=A0A933GKT3_UNCTE|nr:fumarate reductase subunit C [Candidatus Tectomicrobia bacterium]
MKVLIRYTLYHPKWYRPRMSVWWWLKKWSYTKFILRELTSLAVAYFAVIILLAVWSLASGPEFYNRFMARMASRPFFVLNMIAFFMVLFHSVTWLNLAPKAMLVSLKGKRVSDRLIIMANYGAWAVVTIMVAWFLVRG